MTAYPFSGTLRANILDPVQIDPVIIIERYCKEYGITIKELQRRHSSGRVRRMDCGLNLSAMRMAIGYYLRENTDLSTTKISELIGYGDHTTIIKNDLTVMYYLQNQDETFTPYWETLLKIA